MNKYTLGGISLSSSVDGEKLGNTVKSVILGLSSLIIMVSSAYGLNITEAQVVVAASQIGLSISAIWFCFGLIMKVVVKISSR